MLSSDKVYKRGTQNLVSSDSVKEIDEQALQDYGILISKFALLLGCSILDLECTMALIIDVTGIRRHEWAAVELTINKEETNRTIDDLGAMCYHLTRFTREELKTLYRLFFRAFPENSYVFVL